MTGAFSDRMRFLDTNVLIYSLDDPIQSRKSRIANDVIYAEDWAISVQVLQEFYVQAIRVSREGCLTPPEAADFVEHLSRRPVQPLTLDILQAAIATHQRYRISYWDAAIIEAARALRCHTVLSEDLQPGQDFGGILVVNPFTPSSH